MKRRNTMQLLVGLMILISASTKAHNVAQNHEAKQLETSETASLIELLKLPSKTDITQRKVSLKQQASYKLFLGSRMDFSFESEVKNWVQKWKEKDGKIFGELKIVTEIKEADIILARYQNIWETTEEASTSDPTTDLAPLGGYSKLTYKVRLLYSYLLLPQTNDFEVAWRQRKKIRVEEKQKPISASDMLSALAKLIKSKQ